MKKKAAVATATTGRDEPKKRKAGPDEPVAGTSTGGQTLQVSCFVYCIDYIIDPTPQSSYQRNWECVQYNLTAT